MIDGTLCVCNCGADVRAIPNIVTVTRNGTSTWNVDWVCNACKQRGRLEYQNQYFRKFMAPAIREQARPSESPVTTPPERMLKGWAIDLEAVETVNDLDLHWRAQNKHRIKQEAGRGK